jgi:hypothetical protein
VVSDAVRCRTGKWAKRTCPCPCPIAVPRMPRPCHGHEVAARLYYEATTSTELTGSGSYTSCGRQSKVNEQRGRRGAAWSDRSSPRRVMTHRRRRHVSLCLRKGSVRSVGVVRRAKQCPRMSIQHIAVRRAGTTRDMCSTPPVRRLLRAVPLAVGARAPKGRGHGATPGAHSTHTRRWPPRRVLIDEEDSRSGRRQ